MKNKIIKIKNLIFMCGLLLLVNVGCVDLNETPKDFTGPANFYNSKSQVEAAFVSSMQRLYSEWSVYSYGQWIFTSDDQMYGGELVFGNDQGGDLWGAHYRAIADLNPAIKALNDDKLGTSVSQGDKDALMGQAKFIRAFNYFSLVRLFGAVPLITEGTNPVTDEITRTPIVDIYGFIETDLLSAIQNLPDTWPSDNHGRPAKGVAKALLAKVYITMATAPLNDATKYAKARDMAADVMDDGIYSLVTDIDEVFALENSYGPEVMWSFNATADDPSTPAQIYLPGSMDGWGDFKSEKKWGESFPAQPRKDAYLLLEDSNGDPYTTFDGSTPFVKKFLYDPENWQRYTSVQNVPLLRYADVLLLFAEAANMANGSPTQAAADAANMVINRANGNIVNAADPLLTTGMTKDAFDAAVIQQRNLELCFEYDRWFDIQRKRLLEKLISPGNTMEDIAPNFTVDDYLWPIPQTDLRLNSKLTQNPGYTSPGG